MRTVRWMNRLAAIVLSILIFSPNVFGEECINNIDSGEALVRSNICVFDNTGLVTIDSVSRKYGSNPFAWFGDRRVYIFKGTVSEVFQGKLAKSVCLKQTRERPFGVSNIKGQSFIVSVDDTNSDCYVLAVGGMVQATEELISVARGTQKNEK